ncbi:hypothetical protein NTGM5_160017 [Candidatus Nitrotoga sp. M5]|nr:hypothetical protein NTGM5_160017 [Candidatus Nitrotoga sp. M5]
MSGISNEWRNLEMREGIFKDKQTRSGRSLLFVCVFILLFIWSVPVHSIVSACN